MPDFTPLNGTLQQTVALGSPLLIAALGETVVQRSGVVNVGMEGMMLNGAFAATLVTLRTGNPYLGILAAAFVALLTGLLFAIFAVRMAANQVVVGVVVNLLSVGLTGALYQFYFGKGGSSISTASLPHLLWEQNILTYLAVTAVPCIGWWLFRTRQGLEIRACGEQPAAAEASGINVLNVRTMAVLFGGAMSGVAGAFLSIGNNNTFVTEMTSGRGFIALAIVTSGRWNPLGCLIAALIFGFADALQYRGQSLGLHIPKDLLLALPYVVTLVILLRAAKGGLGPASLGRPYRRS